MNCGAPHSNVIRPMIGGLFLQLRIQHDLKRAGAQCSTEAAPSCRETSTAVAAVTFPLAFPVTIAVRFGGLVVRASAHAELKHAEI